ncbi:MAG TPA: c-type cytochrome [Thermoanaerobaculia bacterium]|nr:c-type cytochrome [Thermoanaerobaculia bacterium]
MATRSTPPEKRPDRHYDFGGMNMLFALSSLALLAVTIWMVVADYALPWKRLQAEFRTLERAKVQRDMEAERRKIDEVQTAQLEKDIAAAEKDVAAQEEELAKLRGEERDWGHEVYAADASWRATKSLLDTARYQYDEAIQGKSEGEIAENRREVERLQKKLRDEKMALEEATAQRAAKQQALAQRRAALTTAQERLEALREGLANLETRLAALSKDLDFFVLNAPLMDFVQPSLKIEQVILPGLYHDINFTDVDRVDRCMTCHVAANRPGFEDDDWKQPFRSHPRLDLFVGDGSPHPYTRFGCTTCHGGLDRATEFARAGHTPESAAEQKEWEEKWGWKKQPYLETPILPASMSEAGCISCHAGGVWTPRSEHQDVGRELIVHMGCQGCHPIELPPFQGLRKAGPSLERIAGKTTPQWAYRWIEAPREFHPTTWMPHFFYQENMDRAGDRERQRAEIAGIVAYLWSKSERPQYPPPPPGDPAAGKRVFETVGCAGCHVLDGKAKRDDFFPTINRLHGPNLVRTGSKVDPGWLYAWVRDPKQFFPETNMPDLRLTDREAADVTAYLLSSRDPKYERLRLPGVPVAARDQLVLSYLLNTNTIERSQQRLREMSGREKLVFLGEQSIAKYGCYGCHDIDGFGDFKPIGTELTEEGSKPLHQFDFGHAHDVAHTRQDWLKTKIMHPRVFDEGKEQVKDYNELLKMPSYGMSQREADAVLANLLGFNKESVVATRKAGNGDGAASLAAGRKLITRYNCQGCHLIEEHGHAIKSVIRDPALLPPNLAAEGARVQGDWLFAYLHDPSRVSMRPWLTVRMPTFKFSDEEVNTVISYFASRDTSHPLTTAPVAAQARDLAVGEVVFNMFQCAKCHPSGPVAPGAATAELAPSLLLAAERLRHVWVPSWIEDPQKWVPGTRMPSFFPEVEPGKRTSPALLAIDQPRYAADKARLVAQFGSEAALRAYLADVPKVSAAMRDHIWRLAGGLRAGTAPAPVQEPAQAPVAAGGAP